MKQFVWLPLALLVGMLIGSLAPRSEIRRLKKELDCVREPASGAVSARTSLTGVTTLLGIDRGKAAGNAQRQAKAVSAYESSSPTSSPPRISLRISTNAPNVTAQEEDAASPDNTLTPEERFRERIERAAELWRMRSEVARATFISDAELDKPDQDTFNMLLEAMNIRMANRVDKWAVDVKTGKISGEEAGIHLIRDVTDVMTLTYDEMDRKLKPGWRDNLEKPLNLTDYINPEVALPLADVKDEF